MDDSAISTAAASRVGGSQGQFVLATVLLCLANIFNALDRGALAVTQSRVKLLLACLAVWSFATATAA